MKIATVIRFKVYFDRSNMYRGYARIITGLFVLLGVYREAAWGVWFFDNILWAFPAFLVVFFIGSVFVGYLDKRFVRPNEQKEIISTNPLWMDMYSKVKDIHREMNKG